MNATSQLNLHCIHQVCSNNILKLSLWSKYWFRAYNSSMSVYRQNSSQFCFFWWWGGFAAVAKIFRIVEESCFGPYIMEVTVILRNTLLLSTVLSNCESWYNLALSDIEEMEAVDGGLIQRTLEKTFSTHKEMLFLELGIIPIRFIIYSRKKRQRIL